MSEMKKYLAVVLINDEERMWFMNAQNDREVKKKLKDRYGKNVEILNILEYPKRGDEK